jgi:filamentous hemagglutinin
MMLSGMNRLKTDGVQINGIRGFWSEDFGSTNLDAYWNNIATGMSPQNAAANTWTGRFADRLGYTNISVPQTPLGMTPQPGIPVVTIFKKP